MRYRPLHHPAPAGKINVTPLIDVVMVLIVFYLIVGKLASDQTQVNLPVSAATSANPDKGIVLNLALDEKTGQSRLVMDGVETPVTLLADALRSKLPELSSAKQFTPVSLRADRRLAYASVQPVINACRDAGLVSLRLVTVTDAPNGGGK